MLSALDRRLCAALITEPKHRQLDQPGSGPSRAWCESARAIRRQLAAHAAEIDAGNDLSVGVENVEWARQHALAAVFAVLCRLPDAPNGGGRVGELMRVLDAALRQ